MTKKELVYLGLTRANGEDVSPDRQGKYHKKEVQKYFGMAYADLMRQAYQNLFRWRDYGQLDPATKAYESVEVKYDEARKEYYCELPVSVVQLPNNAGVRMIAPMCDQESAFKYTTNGSSSFMNKLEVRRIDKSKRYYIEKDRAYLMNVDEDTKTVLMKLVTSFEDLEDEDEVPVIAGLDQALFDNAMQRMINKIPADDHNDNSSKIAGNG